MTLGLLLGGDAAWTALLLVFALLLDRLLGEPDAVWRRLPHPAAAMGRLVGWADLALNDEAEPPEKRRQKGILAALLFAAVAFLLGWLLQSPPLAGPLLACAGATILLAQKSLTDHVLAVARGLAGGLEAGRRAVSRIVGRDPESLDEAGVARAAAESAAENFSDGVVAPAFWFLLGGLPGIILYKTINTADSMIGHRTDRHREFGWASARLDDLLNLLPARFSALLIALGSPEPLRALRAAWRDADKHASPNAGWPEAAMAGGLNLALAGPRVYGGVETADPYLNPTGRQRAGAADVERAVEVIDRAHVILVGLLLLIVAFG